MGRRTISILFTSWHGKPLHPSSITTWWRRFVSRHQLRYIRFHDLRHTSATLLINSGVHAKIISSRLGHADIRTTMNIYGHALQEADREATKHFDKLFTNNKKRSRSIKLLLNPFINPIVPNVSPNNLYH